MNVEPRTLHGEYIRLEPLSAARHLEELQEVGSDPSLFRWFAASYATPEQMQVFVQDALSACEDGSSLPFTTMLQSSGTAIGSTRFCNITPEKERVEIGWTWITPEQQRTPANTEAKYLMLRHAFEEWECARVEFETAASNQPSRKSLARVGATEEGRLRKHMIIQGELQDSVLFSILDSEWPSIRSNFERKLDRPFER